MMIASIVLVASTTSAAERPWTVHFGLPMTDRIALQDSLGDRYIPMDIEIALEDSGFKADNSISGPYLGLRAEF